MRGGVANAGSWLATDQNGGRTLDDGIRRADADRDVANHGGRQLANQHGGNARADHRSAHMRDGRQARGHHRADMQVGHSCSGGAWLGVLPCQLIMTMAPLTVVWPEAESSAVALPLPVKPT